MPPPASRRLRLHSACLPQTRAHTWRLYCCGSLERGELVALAGIDWQCQVCAMCSARAGEARLLLTSVPSLQALDWPVESHRGGNMGALTSFTLFVRVAVC